MVPLPGELENQSGLHLLLFKASLILIFIRWDLCLAQGHVWLGQRGVYKNLTLDYYSWDLYCCVTSGCVAFGFLEIIDDASPDISLFCAHPGVCPCMG
jgi:hypothetical protein